MIHDEERYNLILDKICCFVGPAMVLANRVEYLQRMCSDYKEYQYGNAICLSGQGQSKKAKAERKQALEALNNGELDCIFATYQLAKEGLDVPNLRHVVFATPEKDETTVIQSVGRVGRKAEGKTHGTVWDFVDLFGMYQGYFKKRKGYYKKIGAEVVE
jgi:superfamily II DNA/RNA helicase